MSGRLRAAAIAGMTATVGLAVAGSLVACAGSPSTPGPTPGSAGKSTAAQTATSSASTSSAPRSDAVTTASDAGTASVPATPPWTMKIRPTPLAPGAASAITTDSGQHFAEKLPPIVPTIVSHGPRNRKRVALTFDLCERMDYVDGFNLPLAETLIAKHAPATLFVGGKWAETHQQAARWLGSQPLFEIGQHSYSHHHMPQISLAWATQEIVRAQDSVARYTGHTPRLFRFPFGEPSKATLRLVGATGLKAIQWDVETGDPDPNQTKSAIMADVKRQLKPGSIIIMHMNGRGVHSAETLPGLIDYLRAQGYELVNVSELLK